MFESEFVYGGDESSPPRRSSLPGGKRCLHLLIPLLGKKVGYCLAQKRCNGRVVCLVAVSCVQVIQYLPKLSVGYGHGNGFQVLLHGLLL
jgi:hypothetical protein